MTSLKTEQRLARLADQLQSMPWPKAVSQYAGTASHGAGIALFHDMIARHTGNRLLLTAGGREAAAVVDGGVGTTAIVLAREYRAVYALYTCTKLLEIAKARVRHLGIDNIHFRHCRSVDEFPEVPRDLDCIVVQGAGGGALPEAAVANVRDHLSATGSLLVGGEWPGASGLQQMFRLHRSMKRSFPKVEWFGYDRGYTDSWEIRPLQGPAHGCADWLKRFVSTWRSRTAVCVGSRQAQAASYLDRIKTDLSRMTGTQIDWEHIYFANPAGITAIARTPDGRQKMVIRIPLNEPARACHERNVTNLRALARLKPDGFRTPQVVAYGDTEGYRFSAESAVPGEAVSEDGLQNEDTFRQVLAAGTNALLSLHLASRQDGLVTGELFETMVERPLATASRLMTTLDPQDGFENLPSVLQAIRQGLYGAALPAVFSHGDYTVDNFRLLDGRVAGVFDWDLGHTVGLPLVDLLYLIASTHMKRSGRGVSHAYAKKCVRLEFDEAERGEIRRYCAALGIRDEYVRPLALLTWLHHLGLRNLNPEPYNYCRTFWTETLQAAGAAMPSLAVSPEAVLPHR